MMRASLVKRWADLKAPSLASTDLDLQSDFGTLGVIRTYRPGSELLQQGAVADDVYLVHEGVVKLVWSEATGKQTIVGLRRCGAPLGVSAVITGEPSPMSAVTLVPSVLERISGERFLRRLQTDAAFAWKVHLINSREMHEQLNWLGEMACCSARKRLARVFVRFIAFGEMPTNGAKNRLRLPLKRKEIAELIGITPEHLSRLLHELSREGVLSLRDGWIAIKDSNALAALLQSES